MAFEENIRNEDVFIIQSTNPPSDNIWVSVTNNETSTANITVSLTIVQLEA